MFHVCVPAKEMCVHLSIFSDVAYPLGMLDNWIFLQPVDLQPVSGAVKTDCVLHLSCG